VPTENRSRSSRKETNQVPALPTITPEAELPEVRTALADGAKVLLELRSTPADKRGETFEADARETVDFLHDINLIHDSMERAARVAEPEEPESKGGKSLRHGGDGEVRSLGAQFVEAEGYDEWAGSERRGGTFQTEVRNLIGGFTVGGFASGSDAWLPVATPQMVTGSMQRRRAFVRDLMSVQSTGLKVIPYLREVNQLTNETGAQMTAEGSAKAEVTMNFERYNAIVEKITAWLPATDEILSDAPTLRGYIDTRLEYMLMIREEQQVLAGNGTSPQLPGLDSIAGTQDQAAVAGDFPGTIAAAIGKVENVDGEADGFVGNPIDYWTAVGKRHADQFDNGFGGNAPATVSGITWGLPSVRTRAMASGDGWVGSWRLGSTLFDRQQTTIEVGNQHSDYFTRNLVAIRAEKRVAVAWHRPNLFVDVVVPTT
jgi:HK97 family phage major capsid protein